MKEAPVKFVFVATIWQDYESAKIVGIFATQRAAKDALEDEVGRKLRWNGDRKDCHAKVAYGETAGVQKIRFGQSVQ